MNLASPFGSAFQVALHAVEDDTLAILSLLKGQGLSRILASPTLVTMSGQEAEFMVGGEYPYPIQGDSGHVSIEFKRFGVMLRFTPMLVGKETLTIQVEPEVSSLDFSLTVSSAGVAVPGLRTRRGSTTLQLKDGQTFAMAGLLNEETRTVLNKIPFLGDIPILGALFTSKEFQKSESELVIIVTPRLVRAMNPDEVPRLPGEGENDNVSDADFFLLNRVRNPGPPPSVDLDPNSGDLQGFTGETGFAR
jgi:pilus assembly protein CpaC